MTERIMRASLSLLPRRRCAAAARIRRAPGVHSASLAIEFADVCRMKEGFEIQ